MGADGETLAGTQATYFDAATGISFNSQLNDNEDNNFFVGVGYHHFTKPNKSFYKEGNAVVNPKLVVSTGVKFSVTEAGYFTIQGDYSTQGPFREIIAGAMYGIKLGEDLENPKYTLHGGAFLRVNDALIPVVKLDYHPFSVSLSYDVNLSQLKTSTKGRGGFELGISYVGFNKRRSGEQPSFSLCPKF
jgi:hypothetical protein